MNKKPNIIKLKKYFLSLLISFLCFINANAQELIFKEFKHLEGNTTARINRKRDVNGQNCAIIIIKHNFKNFKVESGKGYEALEEKTGETWLWLSPDEYRLVIRKVGYLPFPFDLKNKLLSLETYELTITDGFANLTVNAPKAQIWLDNKPVAQNKYVFVLKEGRYVLKATREKYYEEEKFMVLNAGDIKELNFNLKPKLGKLILNSEPSGANEANIYISDSLSKYKTDAIIPLIIGEYKVRLEKNGFLPYSQMIQINENEDTKLNARMLVDPTLEMTKHKKKRNFWMISTAITGGVGLFSYLQSEKLYSDYQTATNDATDINKKIKMYDTITPIALGVAGICLINSIIHASKHGKAKRKIKLNPSYFQSGASLSLSYAF